MKVNTEFGEYNIFLDIARYSYNNNIAIQLFDEEDGCPFATITTNIIGLPNDCIAIDTNNCPWAEDFLDDLGVLIEPLGEIQSGFCEYPVYKIDLEKLEQLTKGETL